jgi:elongation factor 2 kinase
VSPGPPHHVLRILYQLVVSHIVLFQCCTIRLKDAAAKAVADGDPWLKHHMERIPAERVIRHMYNPETQTWFEDETIVKMEKEPFTHGAMRFCYRMKKRSPPPQSASNHRFHNYGWTRASNYVAKAYQKNDVIDISDEAKNNVRNDILLQYEASHWSQRFNERDPPKKIIFIRAYAIEFPDRPGKPWFAVERFISGSDSYGVAFHKHNTNSGFVDEDLHRFTPQVFSAFSFYASRGNRLVADIQGVGDLYTDPQVLSSDYRFGDGDLGPRGMALFFKTFRHNTLADCMGIPVFALSNHELRFQAKYEDDVFSMSDDANSFQSPVGLDRFAAMDLNRSNRQSALQVPPQTILPDDMKDTERRSNQKRSSIVEREDIRKLLRKSFNIQKPVFTRTTSEVDEVKQCLELAKQDFHFDMKIFHRKLSGELLAKLKEPVKRRPSLLIRTVSEPMNICDQTKMNLGKVHHQLAILHGMGRFPEVVPNDEAEDAPPHDAFSVLFHLCHAASLGNVAACLALGRLHAGLDTCVSPLLHTVVPVDFDAATALLRRAIDSEYPPAGPKVAAACILYQIFLDEQACSNPTQHKDDDGNDDCEPPPRQSQPVSDKVLINLLQDILALTTTCESERQEKEKFTKRCSSVGGACGFIVGDRVEGKVFVFCRGDE